MSEFPCKNRSCSSYGKPHPNCQCYGMAEGGEAKPFCNETRPHQEGCQYFADGGEAEPKWEDTKPIPKEPDPTEDSAMGPPTWKDTKPVEEEPNWDNTTAVQPEEPTWENTTGKYETTAQKIATGLEGGAQGYAGPIATLIEKGLSKLGVPELSDEDIKGRRESNPGLYAAMELGGLGAGLATGTGEAALLAKGIAGAAKLAKVGEGIAAVEKFYKPLGIAAKLGSAALQGAFQTGAIQVGDNISKALIGQGDPNESVAAKLWEGVGGAGLIGGAAGALGSAANQTLSKLADAKKGTYFHSLLSGIGETANGIEPEQSYARYLNEKAYDTGASWWKYKMLAPGAVGGYNAIQDVKHGVEEGNILGGVEDAAKDLAKSAAWGLGLKIISKPASAVFLKALSNGETNPRAIFQMIDYANQVNSGAQKMTRAVESIFKIGAQQSLDKYDFEKQKFKLDKYIDDGGINQDMDQAIQEQQQPVVPGYAEGGDVKKPPQSILQDDAISKHLPEQSILMTAAKARISNYLTNLKPKKNQPKLAFDAEPDQTIQQKSYNNALDIAVNPMSILKHLNKGTLEPEHLRHFNGLYPEVNNVLQKKLTEQVIKSQLSGNKPSYAVRQGLSMLLGTPLSSDLSPQNILAAQSTFQAKATPPQASQGQAPAPKKNTAKLTKSNQAYLTGNQALVGRQQKQS